jgi:hypothetical protein
LPGIAPNYHVHGAPLSVACCHVGLQGARYPNPALLAETLPLLHRMGARRHETKGSTGKPCVLSIPRGRSCFGLQAVADHSPGRAELGGAARLPEVDHCSSASCFLVGSVILVRQESLTEGGPRGAVHTTYSDRRSWTEHPSSCRWRLAKRTARRTPRGLPRIHST